MQVRTFGGRAKSGKTTRAARFTAQWKRMNPAHSVVFVSDNNREYVLSRVREEDRAGLEDVRFIDSAEAGMRLQPDLLILDGLSLTDVLMGRE